MADQGTQLAPDDAHASSGTGEHPRHWSTRTIVAIILGATLLVAASFAIGRVSASGTVTPSTTSAEAGFARDMQTHHLQAVDMSMILRSRTDDPGLQLLAYDIATTQAQQSGQMFGWLDMWGLPQAAPEPSMTWMTRPTLKGEAGHQHGGTAATTHIPGEPMPGMATEAQLTELRSLTGAPAEKLYLQLMIAHHHGGVDMAKAILERSTNRVVVDLARSMLTAQQAEIDYMEELLQRYP